MADLEFEPLVEPSDDGLTDERLESSWSGFSEPVPAVPLRVEAGDERFAPARPTSSWTGVFVTPPRTVLGLRVWPDSREFELDETVPVSLFDIEKIVRMLLHQSGLAVETLAAGRRRIPDDWKDAGFDPRQAVEWGITDEILLHYCDAAAPFLRDDGEGLDPDLVSNGEWLHRTRLLLTGLALAEGRMGVDLDYLLETTASDALTTAVEAVVDGQPDARRELFDAAAPLARKLRDADPKLLPSSPDGYDELDAWLVDCRQHALV